MSPSAPGNLSQPPSCKPRSCPCCCSHPHTSAPCGLISCTGGAELHAADYLKRRTHLEGNEPLLAWQPDLLHQSARSPVPNVQGLRVAPRRHVRQVKALSREMQSKEYGYMLKFGVLVARGMAVESGTRCTQPQPTRYRGKVRSAQILQLCYQRRSLQLALQA